MAYYAELFEPLTQEITKGEVLLPTNPSYEKSLRRWSSTCVKRACVVVKPIDAQEVSAAIQFATSTGLPIAVHCGGRSTGGASSSEGGIVIDLSLMRSVDVDPAAQTASVGGGCLTKHVDEAVSRHGLAAVSGTDHTVGYGGFVLSGGYSFLTPLHGLGCDNLLEVEVVLADGSIVKASEKKNSDLFWALRGAGPQFGVCTRLTVRLHKQGDAWAGLMVFAPDKLPDIVAFAKHVHEHHDGRQSLSFGCTTMAPTSDPALVCAVFFNGSQGDAEAYFKPLLDAGPRSNSAQVRPWHEVNGIMSSLSAGSRKTQGSANFVMPPNTKDIQATFDKFFEFVEDTDVQDGSLVMWEVVPYDKIRELDNTATAFPGRNEFYQISTVFQWDDAGIDDIVREFNIDLTKELKSTGIKNGVQGYNNYDGIALTPEEAYGGNVKRLRELKRKYDPTNVFFKWHPILPASGS